ncbi:MAG: glycosyltransferase [Candidatus Eremiobacteraeota bacterium]|nr:glycosyltransferase [Candidatus Eremiobacteraeota bacterium]
MAEPQLSVVIPVYNNWWLTARCLRELDALRRYGPPPFETIVVDNASTDETPEAIGTFPHVRYLRHDSNRNFAGACNAGARAARAPLTLLLNNDAYPLGDPLTPLVEAFGNPEVAVAGGALFFEDGVTQAAGLVALPNAHWHYYCRNLPPTLADVRRSRNALGVSGAAMAVRTRWFLANGGFDDAFVNGFEDIDLCLRAREESRTIAYVAEARFAHYEAASAGRFAHEAENERLFYGRWAAQMAAMPRTARGEVGAIVLEDGAARPLLDAALDDLAGALRGFGHPIVRGAIAPWRQLDRRFRRSAKLRWFGNGETRSGVTIDGAIGNGATIRTHGASALEVPWLPCASVARVERLALRRSHEASCNVVGVAGDDGQCTAELARRGFSPLHIDAEILLGRRRPAEVSCVVHCGLTDESAFGNVLLAQGAVPAVVLERAELCALFAPDVAVLCHRETVADVVARFASDPALRARYGELVAGDARRRFSPRRSAIRVVDLLCAARFGLERSATARTNTPL